LKFTAVKKLIILGFQAGDYEECCVLECRVVRKRIDVSEENIASIIRVKSSG
jgi:hypothetical protein